MNELIYSNTDFNKYITFFYGVLDRHTNRFAYTNAGHNPPFLLRADGGMEKLETGGLPIGLMPGSTYEEAEIELGPDDLLLLYTDGVSEAMDAESAEFGEDRIERHMREGAGLSAEELLDRIAADVDAFTQGLPQGDDITMLVLKRLAGP
jgi:phosphoserine phosphatase RsbU/P